MNGMLIPLLRKLTQEPEYESPVKLNTAARAAHDSFEADVKLLNAEVDALEAKFKARHAQWVADVETAQPELKDKTWRINNQDMTVEVEKAAESPKPPEWVKELMATMPAGDA